MSSATKSDEVTYRLDDHVATITINRRSARNALSLNVTTLLVEAFSRAQLDDDVWIIVLTADGPEAFCAGGDLKEFNEMAARGEPIPQPMTGPQRNLYETVLETYKPTLAVLNGSAIAGGCELALACDLRIAADHAKIGMPEAKRGMGANFASVLLPRIVPRPIALEMLYTGRLLEADEALRWGLFNRTAPYAELEQAAGEFVGTLAANAPLSLRRYKEMATKGWELPVHAALRLNAGPNPYASEDRVEGIRAWVEKREPQWSAR